jgi:hypothetical protein
MQTARMAASGRASVGRMKHKTVRSVAPSTAVEYRSHRTGIVPPIARFGVFPHSMMLVAGTHKIFLALQAVSGMDAIRDL